MNQPSRGRRMTAAELARLYAWVLLVTAGASALVACLCSHLIVNRTPSLPLGVYWLSTGERPKPGELVAFPIPAQVRSLVLERGYLPPRAELVKTVVAVAGDEVCAAGSALVVRGKVLGTIAAEDSAGRPLPQYAGCGALRDGQLFVGSPYAKSFDSRAFGPIAQNDVRGTVRPLWTY